MIKEEYLVELPEELDVPGYEQIPRYGLTYAESSRKAIANHVFRHVRIIGPLVVDQLNKRDGGAEGLAHLIPHFYDGNGVPSSRAEQNELKHYALALELAGEDGVEITDGHVSRAVDLLRMAG